VRHPTSRELLQSPKRLIRAVIFLVCTLDGSSRFLFDPLRFLRLAFFNELDPLRSLEFHIRAPAQIVFEFGALENLFWSIQFGKELAQARQAGRVLLQKRTELGEVVAELALPQKIANKPLFGARIAGSRRFLKRPDSRARRRHFRTRSSNVEVD
jgi:hypothetical protein